MSRRQSINSGGVWPGYVAAVAGLVQSLMFVSAIVATVVYLMGMLGQAKHQTTEQGAAPAKQAIQAPMPKVSKEAWARSPEYETKDGFRSLSVLFPVDQVKLDAHTEQQVKHALSQLKAAGATQWRVIGHEKADEALSPRQAFFRVQTLRSALIASGIKVDRIEQRILPADAVHHPDNQVVVVPLVGLPSNPAKGQ